MQQVSDFLPDEPENEPGDEPGGASGEPGPGKGTLRGKFLLASANLTDFNFCRTVVLIVRHDEEGALGLVLNRPFGITLDQACSDEVEAARGVDLPLFNGGPVAGPLVAIHNVPELAREEGEPADLVQEGFPPELADLEKEPWAEEVTPGVWFCARREALESLMRHVRDEDGEVAGREPLAVKFIAGYAGWGAGQLESELAEGSWVVADAGIADVYAGGVPQFPTPPPSTPLPPGASELLIVLSQAIEGGGLDASAGLAAGLRQWVRVSTRANLSRMVDPKRIPPDPFLN